MLIYLITFFVSYINSFIANKTIARRTYFLFFSGIAILVPALLAGFRDLTVGHDLNAYMVPNFRTMHNVDEIKEFFIVAAVQQLEIFYQGYNFLISRFTDDFFWPLFIQQVIVLTIVYKLLYSIRNSINYPLAFLIYLLFIFCDSMTMNRQIFAIAIIAYSYIYILRKKPLLFLITVTIAFGFHNSAVFGYLLYPLFTWINNQKKSVSILTVLIFFGAGLVLFLSFPQLLSFLISKGLVSPVYERYVSSGYNVHKADLLLIVFCFIFGLITSKGIDKKYSNNIKLLSIATFFILLCGIYNDTAQRAAIYIEIYLFIQILSSIKSMNETNRQVFSVLFVLLMLFNFSYIATTTQFAEAIPYTSTTLGIGK
ncbi:EpsG family protein [Mangrovibacterium marinum]|uniref:EpsG family protein n=1 Tax=Mangrovibacterium marinum TaxID=1639118 RepID=UPI002A1872F2|nr:EpsG family protein [Mangrovibacterium marinum]